MSYNPFSTFCGTTSHPAEHMICKIRPPGSAIKRSTPSVPPVFANPFCRGTLVPTVKFALSMPGAVGKGGKSTFLVGAFGTVSSAFVSASSCVPGMPGRLSNASIAASCAFRAASWAFSATSCCAFSAASATSWAASAASFTHSPTLSSSEEASLLPLSPFLLQNGPFRPLLASESKKLIVAFLIELAMVPDAVAMPSQKPLPEDCPLSVLEDEEPLSASMTPRSHPPSESGSSVWLFLSAPSFSFLGPSTACVAATPTASEAFLIEVNAWEARWPRLPLPSSLWLELPASRSPWRSL
mmetsp:Transcript_19994/g.46532  ORF Transcript_19994/g.46532 Transcript_19994/m.46532 type:complete len:298 (+) Transcript_19994:1558-2451(+)